MARFRFFFLPLGLCALVAVGVHAAANVASGELLWVADRVDAFFDAIFSKWSFTAPLVDWIGFEQRRGFARGVALIWELSADALLVWPMLDYQERTAAQEWAQAREMARRIWQRPTPLRIVRPIATALVSVAGACSVARLAGGSVRLSLHAPTLGKLIALVLLFALLFFFAGRAAFRALESADTRSRRKAFTWPRAATLGLAGAVLLVPLAIAAVSASPIGSFFR